MPGSVLVGYATRSGSTREVAEAVAAALAEDGLQVDCRPMRQVQSLEGVDAVVLGAPLFMFHWHKDALRFLARHRAALAARPVAIFALGPFNNVPKEFEDARGQLDRDLLKAPWFKPAVVEIFGGKFDPATLPFPWKLIPGLKQIPTGDIRDWAAIRAWAAALPATLGVARP